MAGRGGYAQLSRLSLQLRWSVGASRERKLFPTTDGLLVEVGLKYVCVEYVYQNMKVSLCVRKNTTCKALYFVALRFDAR